MKKQSKQHKICLWIKRWWFSGTILVGLAIAFLIICLPYLSPEHRITNDHTVLLWYLGSLAVTCGLFLCLPKIVTSSTKKYFITRVLVTGITGGVLALLLPVAVKSTTTGVGGLRHSILLATGGLIAIFTLGETRRKNDIDKKKNKQEKEKNNKDYQRQVRAERRERYTKAVEQLGDEKSTVRMGGVYTLVGLVDEWLEEKSLSDDQRLKEGQVIINNLCAYIRSPLTLASRANLQAEADVRLSIIKEIHDRLQGPGKNLPGAWSDFEYDFSGSAFFYPIDLTNSYYTKSVNFGGSTYEGEADFGGSTYEGEADFGGSTYEGEADFSRSTYEKDVTFSTSDSGGSTYEGEADFSSSTYEGKANFSRSTHEGEADFSGSTYKKDVTFSTSDSGGSTYKGEADFSSSTYHGWTDFSVSTYENDVIFSRSIYLGRADFGGSIYLGRADFGGSTYENDVIFSTSNIDPTYSYRKGFLFSTSNFRSIYLGRADFGGSIYLGRAIFGGSTYEGEAYFSRSIYYQETYFGKDGYSNSSSCFTNRAPRFYDKTNDKNALFGSHNNDFTVDIDKGYPIDLDSEGIPLGCELLNPKQKNDLQDIFHEMEKVNNELLEVKDPKDKARLSKKLRSLTEELHEWREEATTVKAEDVAAEDTES